MKTLKNDWLIGVIILLPLVFIVAFWNRFPQQVVIHFNADGAPNGYADKGWGLFMFPLINIGLYGLFRVLPYIDPAKQNYMLFLSKFRIIQITLHALLTFIFFIVALYSLGVAINIEKVVMYGVLTLMLILGNYMGNIRKNYFIGIRTPWTLADETVWTKTHRLAARLWVFATLVMMIIAAVLPHPHTVFIGYILVISLVPMIYSYVLFRKKEHLNTPE